jgi:hypothetical protein
MLLVPLPCRTRVDRGTPNDGVQNGWGIQTFGARIEIHRHTRSPPKGVIRHCLLLELECVLSQRVLQARFRWQRSSIAIASM